MAQALVIVDIQNDCFPAAQVHGSFLAGIDGLFAKLATADEIAAGL